MAFFDFFTKTDSSSSRKTIQSHEQSFGFSQAMNNNAPDTFKPTSFSDLYALLDLLKVGKTVIVDCSLLKETSAIRVLDILSGATYVLNGAWKTIASEVFMFVPNGSPENGQF